MVNGAAAERMWSNHEQGDRGQGYEVQLAIQPVSAHFDLLAITAR